MDILFMLAAVCPAVIAAGYEMKGYVFAWERALYQFAKWFYEITFFNFVVLYLRGAGRFDFSFLSVQFILKYMLCSMAAIIFLRAVRAVVRGLCKRKTVRTEQEVQNESSDTGGRLWFANQRGKPSEAKTDD